MSSSVSIKQPARGLEQIGAAFGAGLAQLRGRCVDDLL